MFVDISNLDVGTNVEIATFVVNLINWFIRFSAVITVIMIIVGGFQYIFSFGDDKKISRATSTIVFAILGMVLVFLAPTVIQFVLDNFLGTK